MHRPLTAGVVSGRARLAKSALVAARMGADIQNAVEVGVKEAMKAKDKERLAGLRGIKAVLQASAKDKGVDTLPDEECITVLRKLAKQRQESIEAYDKAGRAELAEAERGELAVIEGFLPALADEATTRSWVEEAIAESGATDAKMMGKVMGVLMKKHKGEMDGSLAKRIAEDIFKNGAAPVAGSGPAADAKATAPKKDPKAADKEAPKAAAAGGETRMVWRQGFYRDNVWQRGRYEEMNSGGAAEASAPAAKKEAKKEAPKKDSSPRATPAEAAPAAAAWSAVDGIKTPWAGAQSDLEASAEHLAQTAPSTTSAKAAGAPSDPAVVIQESAAAPWSVLDSIRVPWSIQTGADAPAPGAPAAVATVPAAEAAAPAAGGETRMVWRQGFYRDNVWQRGRYEQVHASAAPAAAASAPAAKKEASKPAAVKDASKQAKAEAAAAAEAKAKAEADARAAEEARVAEEKKAKAEAEAKAKAEAEAKAKAEAEAKAKAEAEAKAKAEAEAKAAEEARIAAEKQAAAEAEAARVAGHVAAGDAAVRAAEEAIAAGEFAAAWAAQEKATLEYSESGDGKKLASVMGLSEKIAAGEKAALEEQARTAAKEEGDASFKRAEELVAGAATEADIAAAMEALDQVKC